MEVLVRRFISIVILIIALLPQWGQYDYSSASNLPPSTSHTFTGLSALLQQLPWMSLIGPVVFVFWLIFRTKVSRNRQLSSLVEGPGWDFTLLAIWLYCAVVWVQVLISVLSNDRNRPGFLYKDLLVAFWIFPLALLASVAARYVTLSRANES